MSRTLRFAGALAAMLMVVVSCSGDDGEVAPTTTAAPTTTLATVRTDDGTLRIGVYLPRTGPGAQLGTSMIGATELARTRINEAGGFQGKDVELEIVDEGASPGFASLLELDVDAIVGPASSLVALSNLADPVSAGILTCSPTASALALDDFPSGGLFFRTIPSDSLQAVAMARKAELTGGTQIAIGYLDDPYGRAFAESLTAAINRRGNLNIVSTVPYSGDDEDLSDEAANLLANEASIIAVIGDADDGSRLIGTISDTAPPADLPDVIVNDQLRGQGSQPVIGGLSPQFRAKIKGVSPLAVSDRVDAPDGLFAANAFDCVNLIALAALSADSDNPSRIAAQMAAVSVGGRVCRTFADCADRLEQGLRIDYDGPSGNTELSTRSGSPTHGQFVEFTFNDDGTDVSGEPFEVDAE